jgi:hypothetical protein
MLSCFYEEVISIFVIIAFRRDTVWWKALFSEYEFLFLPRKIVIVGFLLETWLCFCVTFCVISINIRVLFRESVICYWDLKMNIICNQHILHCCAFLFLKLGNYTSHINWRLLLTCNFHTEICILHWLLQIFHVNTYFIIYLFWLDTLRYSTLFILLISI